MNEPRPAATECWGWPGTPSGDAPREETWRDIEGAWDDDGDVECGMIDGVFCMQDEGRCHPNCPKNAP